MPSLRLKSLHFKVASGVIATILLTSTLYFVMDYLSNRRQLLDELHESADRLANIALQSLLELAMLGRHPELLQQAIERLGANSPVERIALLDLTGVVRFSSNPAETGIRFSLRDPGCRDCHVGSKEQIERSVFIELGGTQILRNVRAVPNRPGCHACHDAAARYNGVLVIDFRTEEISQRLRSDLYESLLRSGLTVLLTLAVLGLLMNKLVINPVAKLTRATARLTDSAEATSLAGLGGSNEIGQLATSFDKMAQRVRTSIRDLELQQAYLQHLVNSLPDGLIVVDRQLGVEMTNDAAGKIWNSAQWKDLLADKDRFPEIAKALDKTFQSGELVTCEVKLDAETTADLAEPSFVEVYCAPLRNAEGEISRVILVVRDITRRKMLETQASRAERLASVGQLAAGLAHEINNPMAAITTCVEGLGRHVDGSPGISSSDKSEISDYLSTVGEAALRCKEITRRLLSASVEREPGKFERVDLAEIIQDAVTLVAHQARGQGVEIGVDIQPVTSFLMGNREKLSQLMLNLLLNSLEAVAPGGKIDIALSRSEEFLELRVADNGCGIPDEDLERIFDPFFTTKMAGRGTGLGLSISQWIVRQHQGRIYVQSRSGQGTTFSILFPLLEEPKR